MFANLIKEMKSSCPKITQAKIAKLLNIAEKSVSARFNHKVEWTRKEMFLIRDNFFPDLNLDYLFEIL